MGTTAIIVAAGRGRRAGDGPPKQLRPLAGVPVLQRTLRAFGDHPRVDGIVLVIHPDDETAISQGVAIPGVPVEIVYGGATRQASVLNGLLELAPDCTRVLIHDAARPLVSEAVIDRVLAALETAPGAAPGVAVVDALWKGETGRVSAIAPRDGLFRAQTPQGFHASAILAAHRTVEVDASDDVEVALAAGLDVIIVEGDPRNMKITAPEDFARAERLLKEDDMDVRLGNGFDVHRFCDGDHVVLCGVSVPFDKALDGHSDADVGMHALTDAIYGAMAEGDIGRHFPPSDPQWKGAASDIFLKHAVALAAERGFKVGNCDVTLICEHPKIGPLAASMEARLAEIMELAVDRISVKATTSERLGFTGRGEGIASIATATLVRG